MRMKLSVKLCLVALAAYLAAAVFGEVQYRVARYRDVTPAYNAVNTEERFMPPSAEHWLGTDNLGRDVGLRLVQGARIAFHVGIMTSLIAIPLGVLLGLLGGYFGGKVDSLVVWLCATVASMPGLLFILAISLVVGQGLAGIYMGIGFTTWVGVCRTVRAEVMKHRDRAYVQAARVLGYSHARIMFRHILPNVAHIILIQFSIRFPSAPRHRRAGRALVGRDDQQRPRAAVAGGVVGDDVHNACDIRPSACVQPPRGLSPRPP